MPATEVDIAIVGAGLIGTALASALRHLPLRIALIEAKPLKTVLPTQVITSGKTIVLSYQSCRILQTLGVGSWLRDQITPITEVRVSKQGHWGKTIITAQQLQLPYLGGAVAAPALQYAFSQTWTDTPSLQFFSLCRVTDIEVADTHATLQLKPEDNDVGESAITALRAQWVVIAEGSESSLRQHLGIVSETQDYKQTAVVATLEVSCPAKQTAFERFTDTGAIALLPRGENQYALVWVTTPEHATKLITLSDKAFIASLQQHVGYGVGYIQHVSSRHLYPLQATRAKEIIRPRCVLLGNAAHALHPIGAQGFNLGLRDIAHFAELIADACRRDEPLYHAGWLTQYPQRRRDDQQRIWRMTELLLRGSHSQLLGMSIVRNSTMTLLNLVPAVQRRVVAPFLGITDTPSRLASGIAFEEC